MVPEQRENNPPPFQQGPLLVATPYLSGTPYDRKVILLVAHGRDGSQGIIVNQALRDSLRQIHDQVATNPRIAEPVELKLGVVQWAPGQLEAEMKSGVWLTIPATESRMMGEHEDLWKDLVRDVGMTVYRDVLGIRRFPRNPSLN
jgi:putative AlgH/UPF0301 family transcriptional regulator